MSTRPASKDLFRLQKVVQLRVTKAHRAYSEKLTEWKQFEKEVSDLQSEVDTLQVELDKVAAYQEQNKNRQDTTVRKEASDRRHWLIYDQDLAIYNLDIARGDLQEATTELNKCKAAWLRAQQREKTIVEQGEQALNEETLVLEELQESELEDLRIAGVSIV